MSDSSRTDSTQETFTKPSVRVIERVAQEEGVDPRELDRPLYDAIDPTAMDQLFTPTGNGSVRCGHISFHYYGYDLSVDSNGNVELQ